ncbi:MAG: hypothetical protein KatS3mg068_0044 [Candidatus Sericytochromatia bacterium]|nr:MAG: hypothetical protein KatS3mg068_0044 [Candidatus Sericytochromatia bacterium]
MNDIIDNLLELISNQNISKDNIQVLNDIKNINNNCYDIFLVISNENKAVSFIEKNYILLYKTDLLNEKKLFLFCKKSFDLLLLNPFISVCIPTYYNKDRGNILDFSIQEWSKSKSINLNLVEFIIVENGSNYYKEDILNKYKLKISLNKIKEANLGKARKISVEKSNSKILLLVNDDTIPSTNLLEKHLFYQLINYKRNIAILGKFIFHKKVLDNNFMKIINDSNSLFVQNKLINDKEYNYYKLFITNNISIKKDLILKVGNFSEDIKKEGEDTDLGYRLLNKINLKIIFKEDLISYHLHKHDINSYIDVLKRRVITGYKIISKYSNEKVYFSLDKMSIDYTLPSEIFINYIINNNDNLFLKYYVQFINFCSYICANLDLLFKEFNKKLHKEINYINNIENVINLIHKKNKKYIDVLNLKNYYLYDNNSFIYDIFNNDFDFILKYDEDFIPVPYTNYLFINVKNNIDKNIEVIFGNSFSFDNLKKEVNFEKNKNIFFSKKTLIKKSYLLENKIVDIDLNLFKNENYFHISTPLTSIKVDSILNKF